MLKQRQQHNRAFVIQFHTETKTDAEHFKGRVEHIESTRSIQFRSLDELTEFMVQILKEVSEQNEFADENYIS